MLSSLCYAASCADCLATHDGVAAQKRSHIARHSVPQVQKTKCMESQFWVQGGTKQE
jgi:hypothetical protein